MKKVQKEGKEDELLILFVAILTLAGLFFLYSINIKLENIDIPVDIKPFSNIKIMGESSKIKIENTQWSQHSQVIFTMTFVKKKRNIYDFIFSGNVSAECTEETYALVKSWLPESVRMPKVKF